MAGCHQGGPGYRAHHAAAARQGTQADHREGPGAGGAVRRAPARGGGILRPAGPRALLQGPVHAGVLQRRRPGFAGHASRGQARRFPGLRHGGRRRVPDRLHQRHHGLAQGLHALSPRRAGHVRPLPAPHHQAGAGRHFLRHAAAGLHLRAGRPAVFPAARGRQRGAGREAHARRAAGADSGIPRHHRVHRADLLPPDGGAGPGIRPVFAQEERVGGRGAARRHASALEAGHASR